MKLRYLKTAYAIKVGREQTDVFDSEKHHLDIEIIATVIKDTDGKPMRQQMIKITPLNHPARGSQYKPVYSSLLNAVYFQTVEDFEPKEMNEELSKPRRGRPRADQGS